MTTDASATPTPPITDAADALAELISGNKRFVSGRPEHGHNVAAAAAASSGQQPHAVVLGCIDSRVPLEAIFDQTFGSICVVRSGAHVIDHSVFGSVEFAVAQLGVPLILVLGHKRCGAVQATIDALRAGERPGGDIAYLVDELSPAVLEAGLDDPEVAEKATRAHVMRTVARLSGVDGADVAGAVYDLDTGLVELLT